MEISQKNTIKTIAVILLLAAISQPIYTFLYLKAPGVERKILWAIEGPIFVILCAFAGSALVTIKRYSLGFSAIAFGALLNVIQVGIGLVQFGPFREAANANDSLKDIAFSVVAFSFYNYNAAKLLLGMAAVVFGFALIAQGSKILGRSSVGIGAIAFVSNIIVMMFGIKGFLPSPVAGGSGVLATILLAICLINLKLDKESY